MGRFFLSVIILLLFIPSRGHAQASLDSVQKIDNNNSQSIKVSKEQSPASIAATKDKSKQHNPKKAALYSALLPGAGQLYNKQYWKIPVVYVGVGVAVYFYTENQKNYRRYRKAYISRLDPTLPDEEPLRSVEELKILQDEYKRWLDLTSLFTAVGYTLQILDAVVFANLKDFDISQDISLRLQPMAMPNGGAGFGLAVKFK